MPRAASAALQERVQLVARLPDGRRAATPEQRVHVTVPTEKGYSRQAYRYEVLDERWNDSIRAYFTAASSAISA